VLRTGWVQLRGVPWVRRVFSVCLALPAGDCYFLPALVSCAAQIEQTVTAFFLLRAGGRAGYSAGQTKNGFSMGLRGAGVPRFSFALRRAQTLLKPLVGGRIMGSRLERDTVSTAMAGRLPRQWALAVQEPEERAMPRQHWFYHPGAADVAMAMPVRKPK